MVYALVANCALGHHEERTCLMLCITRQISADRQVLKFMSNWKKSEKSCKFGIRSSGKISLSWKKDLFHIICDSISSIHFYPLFCAAFKCLSLRYSFSCSPAVEGQARHIDLSYIYDGNYVLFDYVWSRGIKHIIGGTISCRDSSVKLCFRKFIYFISLWLFIPYFPTSRRAVATFEVFDFFVKVKSLKYFWR